MPSESQIIRFGSEKHRKILEALNKRVEVSNKALSRISDKWTSAEEQFLAYKPETEDDATRRSERDLSGRPQYTTLVIPYSYAMLLAAHTYWCSVFLSRDPILQFMGRHGETEDSTQALEAVMSYQLSVGRHIPVLYNWLFDPGKYGLGWIGTYWTEETVTVSRIEEQQQTFLNIPLAGKFKKVKVTENLRGFYGNKIFNIRPQDMIIDPRVSLWNFQEGEFCGRRARVGWNEIVRKSLKGEYFNIDVLKDQGISNNHNTGSNQDFELEGSAQIEEVEKAIDLSSFDIKNVNDVKIKELTVELIPQQWGLGKSRVPEKWFFTWANDRVIIGARPQAAYHNRFPFALLEYEFDAHALVKRSMMEVVEPLQNTLDWLFNSHMFNIRRAMNDQLIVDPSRVVMKDVKDPAAGKLIRLRPEAYGTDPSTAIKQLEVVDITGTHMRDTQVLQDFFQRATGVNDNIMGLVNLGGRKSATEVRSSNQAGITRLKTHAEMHSATGFWDYATQCVQNTQQYYDEEQVYRIAGELAQGNPRFVNVSPETIQGFYDFVPADGTLPVDRFAQANLFRELIMGAAKIPQVGQQYDIAGMFGYAAQLAGLRNINRFKIQVVPDGVAQAGAQAGNLVPAGGGRGVGDDDFDRVPSQQIPNLGTTA